MGALNPPPPPPIRSSYLLNIQVKSDERTDLIAVAVLLKILNLRDNAVYSRDILTLSLFQKARKLMDKHMSEKILQNIVLLLLFQVAIGQPKIFKVNLGIPYIFFISMQG